MTMRRLVLIRHSKAEQDGPTDAERALSDRGLRDATAIGEWLAAQGMALDHVVISPSRRTRQTWGQIAAVLGTAPDPVVDERIYENDVDLLMAIINAAPADASTVALTATTCRCTRRRTRSTTAWGIGTPGGGSGRSSRPVRP